jgi:His/Glu/Gln/Arg/opine family amino acid ABC transporter permease subunit
MDLYQFLNFMVRYVPQLADGFMMTLGVAALAAPAALIWGIVLALPRVAGGSVLAAMVKVYVEVMRNTPLLIQMYLLYFGLPLVGIFLSSIACGAISIALQHGAFISEVIRTGVQSISIRQWEAGYSMGLRRGKVMALIVFPQALLKVTPSIGNQLIVLVKDTSLVSAIGAMDLTLTGKVIIERSGASFEVFIAVALFYLILTSLLGGLVRLAEARTTGRFG